MLKRGVVWTWKPLYHRRRPHICNKVSFIFQLWVGRIMSIPHHLKALDPEADKPDFGINYRAASPERATARSPGPGTR